MALEARIANLEGTVGQIGQRLNSIDARFTNVERKIDVTEERLAGRIDALDDRLTTRIDVLDDRLTTRIDGLDARLGGRIEQLDRRFTWMMGLLVVSIVLPVAEHFVLH